MMVATKAVAVNTSKMIPSNGFIIAAPNAANPFFTATGTPSAIKALVRSVRLPAFCIPLVS